MRCLCVVIALLTVSTVAAAQTPCDVVSSTVYNPALVHVTLPDYAATLPGSTTPLYDRVEFGFFLDGVSPTTGGQPIQVFEIDRVMLKSSGGTCYSTTLVATPTAARAVSARRKRTAPEPETAPWGALSNPFAQLPALTPVAAIRVSK